MTIQTIPNTLRAIDPKPMLRESSDQIVRNYSELTTMLDRLHRRYLDVVRLELEEIGINDINPSQALMLSTLGEGEVPLRDILQRGGYTASTATYMIKKLVDHGYLEQIRATHDRRTIRLKLSQSGSRVVEHLATLQARQAESASADHHLVGALEETTATLRQLDRLWTDLLTFG